jgi:PAS domain S-box-containing protein
MAHRDSGVRLDDVSGGALVVDVPTGEIRAVDDTCCGMIHYSESALVGATLSGLSADGEPPPVGDDAVGRSRVATADVDLDLDTSTAEAAEGTQATFEWRVRTGRGTALPVEARIAATTSDGHDSVVLSLRERSGREAVTPPLERGRDRYRTLFDNEDLVLWEQDFSEARAYATDLADTGAMLGAYLDDHPEELFEILARMDVHRVNDAALDFYGVESKRELVENFGAMMVPDTREGLTAMWQAVVDGERYFCTECKFRPLDGDADARKHELMEVYVPEQYADDYSLVFTTATDITEQKRRERDLEAATERYRAILDRSTDYVLVCDEAGVVEYASPGIETTLGYDPADLVGTDAFEYVHPADRDAVTDAFEAALADPEEDIDVEYRVRTTDDSYRWVEARGGNYLEDPLVGGVMVTIRDIVERKDYEQALVAERDARSTLQRKLAGATSIDAFAGAVCAELVAIDAVVTAAVGTATATATDGIDLLTAEGPEGRHDGRRLLDRPAVAAAVAAGDPEPRRFAAGPVGASAGVGPDGSEGPDGSTGSRRAADRDRSGAVGVALPIVHGEVTRGVLVARLAAAPTVDGRVLDLLRESADVLGYAMTNDERRQALAADDWVQLTLTVGTAGTPLSGVVAATGAPVTVETAFPRRDGADLCHLVVDGDSAAFVDAARDREGIDRVDRVGDGPRVQAILTEPVPSAVLTDYGWRLDEARVGRERTTLTVRLPEAGSLDPVLEALTERFGEVATGEFTTAPTDPDPGPGVEPLSGLTDRQREVLEVAYRGGYFEKPRAQNAGEVADRLGVARPTYDEVLRAAQRNLLATLFDD